MISVFPNRIEILSHGGLGIEQDFEGFYTGVSIPVNEVLASIFLQLRLSERSVRGVPKIVGAYGRDSIRIDGKTSYHKIKIREKDKTHRLGQDRSLGSHVKISKFEKRETILMLKLAFYKERKIYGYLEKVQLKLL